MFEPQELLAQLIRCKSVTPSDDGAMDLMSCWLKKLGFKVEIQQFGEVKNLYATKGLGEPHILFCGHCDVVPANQHDGWLFPPFEPHEQDGVIYGRGAQDMKSGLACFIAAMSKFSAKNHELCGKISLLITSDEEGDGINGTKKMLEFLANKGEKWDFSLVGEPTSQKFVGDVIKNGRRGSLTGRLLVKGVAGHVAYQHLAKNAASKLVILAKKLFDLKLDEGSAYFLPSNLEITQILAGGKATNVIPALAELTFNIRFNDNWTVKSLQNYLINYLKIDKEEVTIEWLGEPSSSFITKPGAYLKILAKAIEEETGLKPRLDTGGGTSDARHIKQYCDVVEFGLVGDKMHKVNESVTLKQLHRLTIIYYNFLRKCLT